MSPILKLYTIFTYFLVAFVFNSHAYWTDEILDNEKNLPPRPLSTCAGSRGVCVKPAACPRQQVITTTNDCLLPYSGYNGNSKCCRIQRLYLGTRTH